MIIGIDASHANKNKRTGVEEYCFQIINELKTIIPPETQVILYCNQPLVSELSDLPPNWEVKVLSWPFSKMWSQLRLSFELFINPVDKYFSPGQLLPFFSRGKKIVTIHDSAFEAYPAAYRFFGRQYLKLMNRLIISKADLIITSTVFNKSELVRFYPSYLVKKNIDDFVKVIPLAYNQALYNSNYSVIRNSFGRYIISIGRLEKKKNTVGLIKAFDLVKKTDKDLKLVLVGGNGAGYEEVDRAINNSPFKDDIIRPGFLNNQELVSILGQSLAFVFPSFYEGFGIPVLEAMAVAVPIVVSDTAALKEVGKEAVLYANPYSVDDLAQKILLILQDKKIRDEKIELGLQMVKKYSWHNTASLTWKEIGKI